MISRHVMMNDEIVTESGTEVIISSDNDAKISSRPGIKLYGTSWQDSTPSIDKPVSIQSKGNSGVINVNSSYSDYSDSITQSLSLQNGIHGVPISTGGNYIDSDGQHWWSDIIDLERKKRYSYIWEKTFNGSEGWSVYKIYDEYAGFSLTKILPEISLLRREFLASHDVYVKTNPQNSNIWLGVNNNNLYYSRNPYYSRTNLLTNPDSSYNADSICIITDHDIAIPIDSNGIRSYCISFEAYADTAVDIKVACTNTYSYNLTDIATTNISNTDSDISAKYSIGENIVSITTENTRYSFSFTPVLNSADTSGTAYLAFFGDTISGNNLHISRIKMEYGTSMTDYDSSSDNGLANWKAYLSENPLTIMTYLSEPVVTELTDNELSEYLKIAIHQGNTTISNDAECGMEVSYRKIRKD